MNEMSPYMNRVASNQPLQSNLQIVISTLLLCLLHLSAPLSPPQLSVKATGSVKSQPVSANSARLTFKGMAGTHKRSWRHSVGGEGGWGGKVSGMMSYKSGCGLS